MAKVIKIDGIEFEAIEPEELKAVPVLSQALDNQWLPRNLLEKAIKTGSVNQGIEKHRQEVVRAEYIRSLINGDQIIINRAYLYNNEIIYRDYLPITSKSRASSDKIRKLQDSREAFKRLLQENVIIPYLLTERSPIQSPSFDTLSFKEWEKLCQEVSGMQCVRLSWDDEQNSEYTSKRIAGRFTDFVLRIASNSRDFKRYIEDLRLDTSVDKNTLKKQFLSVTQKAVDLLSSNDSVNREDLYKAFVIAEGTSSVDRCYDKNKPFASEIKQLLDLAYSRNLPDALDGYLLTPIDSLPRTALQETVDEFTGMQSDITVEDIKTFLQRGVFSLVQEEMYLQDMGLLTLSDVYEIRRMEEWRNYITSLRSLLSSPYSFAVGGAQAVHDNYFRLADQMTTLMHNRYAEKFIAKSIFVTELIIEVGGATLTAVSIPHGDPIIQAAGVATLSGLGKKAVPFAIRYVIRDIASKRASKGLSNSMQLMKGRMKDPAQKWDALLKLIKATGEFKEGHIPADEAAILNPPEPTN